MSTQLKWSPLRSLDERLGIHKGPGIYLIGVMDPALANPGADANYYGQDYPKSFRARYAGMSMSLKYGVASRLRSHALGKGNQQVRDFIAEIGIKSIYYTYSLLDDQADFAEVFFLAHQSDDFLDWNNKGELMGAVKRFFFQHGPPEPMLIDDMEPWKQLEEIENKRQLQKNWESLLAANPKYQKFAKRQKAF